MKLLQDMLKKLDEIGAYGLYGAVGFSLLVLAIVLVLAVTGHVNSNPSCPTSRTFYARTMMWTQAGCQSHESRP